MNKVKGTIKYSINVYFDEETKQYVGICPELDYSGMGDTPDKAALNTDKAVKLALEWCSENNTLTDVLKESGYSFYRVDNKPVWNQKPVIVNFNKELNLV